MSNQNTNVPASFRVIGVGMGIDEVINKIKLLELDGVSAEIAEYPYECIPGDEDKLAIIIFTDLEETANRIAYSFHDAGVLTIGISEDADPSCYDSVMLCDSRREYPEIIKALLQPIVTLGMINYDFQDLSTTLRDTEYFTVKSTSGESVKGATEKLKDVFHELDLTCVDYLTLNLYFNPNRALPIAMNDMESLSQLISKMPETVHVIWSVNHDENLNGDEIRLSAILAVKEKRECLRK
ncbi:MAG: hypothetical protein K2K45_07095 [Muribaculaceae bacterium]|nr:hypothetical protein [Muribaculaceae bacterium]